MKKKTLYILSASSLVVMHFNQDLSAMYWAGLIVFTASILSLAKRLDDERAARNDKKDM